MQSFLAAAVISMAEEMTLEFTDPLDLVAGFELLGVSAQHFLDRELSQ